MKKIWVFILVIILSFAGYYWYRVNSKKSNGTDIKLEAFALKKHSVVFNGAVSAAMNAYFEMADAFVEADTAAVKEHSRRFIQLLDSIPLDELKNDTAHIYDIAVNSVSGIKSNAESVLNMTDIQEMRKDFSMVSENLYPFFRIINYEGENMYWQNCPMAFGDDKEANWISKSKEVTNPYLGKKHPEYRATMLHCGMVKDTIKAQ